MNEPIKGFRKGMSIGVFGEDGKLSVTQYKSINQAKKANRQTKYPVLRPGKPPQKGEEL